MNKKVPLRRIPRKDGGFLNYRKIAIVLAEYFLLIFRIYFFLNIETPGRPIKIKQIFTPQTDGTRKPRSITSERENARKQVVIMFLCAVINMLYKIEIFIKMYFYRIRKELKRKNGLRRLAHLQLKQQRKPI